MRHLRQVGRVHERDRRGDEIGLLVVQHGRHGRERHLDDGVVAGEMQPAVQHLGAHRHVDAGAEPVHRDHLALQILDLGDAAIVPHHVVRRVEAVVPVLQFVADDAQVSEARILDRERERGEIERRDLDLAGRDRRDVLRRGGDVDGIEIIGFAEMLGHARRREQDGRERGRRHDPGNADVDRVGARARRGTDREPKRQNCDSLQASEHDPPSDAGYLVVRA